MKKFSVYLFFLLAVVFSKNVFCQESLSKNKVLVSKEDSLVLSKTILTLPCPFGYETPKECINQTSTKVKTLINSTKSSRLKYEYSVTGGKIKGRGKNITWDLNGFRPGTYTVKVTVTGKAGFGKILTQVITLTSCMCRGDCSYPILEMEASSETPVEGEEIFFTANVSGGIQTSVKFKWKISKGRILEGQNTPRIKVGTKGLAGKSIAATVKIIGLCDDCLSDSTKTLSVRPK